jgi:2-polyprenyl-3-methyl-5-hydroxy-6-metoxy-1,4-benzoquinol methylase
MSVTLPSDRYYGLVRREIAALLPLTATRIVDVGCGVGATAAWLKARYPGSYTIGLEGNPALRDTLTQNVDEAHILDLNGPIPDIGTVDLVLCLDVLEHLVDPAAVLTRLVRHLRPGGTAIVSVPNVAHFSVSVPLLLRGEFTYQESGILDRTHMRFFVRRSAIELMYAAGLNVRAGLYSGVGNPKSRLLNLVTFGRCRDRLARQYILAGQPRAEGASQDPITWSVA